MERGVLLRTEAYPAQELLTAVQRLEAQGYESVWIPEMFGREPTTTAAMLLAGTTRIRIATGIANVYARDSYCMVQTRHTLAELSGGRFILGLGVSNADVNAQRGHPWRPPLEMLSSYLDAMATVEVRAPAPPELGPLYLAAHGPKLQTLAAQRADGVITYLMPPDHTRASRNHIGASPELTVMYPQLEETDPGRARAAIRRQLGGYFALAYYHREWRKLGFSDEDFADGGSDRLVDTIVAWGDADALSTRAAEYRHAGATRLVTLSLQPRRA
ncbi:MAG: LLM class flavin-dependent oxidoreductase [Pseudomonadales bacterium]